MIKIKITTAIILAISIIALCLIWFSLKLLVIIFLVLWFQNTENSIKQIRDLLDD